MSNFRIKGNQRFHETSTRFPVLPANINKTSIVHKLLYNKLDLRVQNWTNVITWPTVVPCVPGRILLGDVTATSDPK